MKLELSAQIRGSDGKKTMPVIRRLREEFEDTMSRVRADKLKEITPILRIGAALGSFGGDAIANVKVKNREAECEVVVAPRNWKTMDEHEIWTLLRPMVADGIQTMLNAADVSCPKSIVDILNNAEQLPGAHPLDAEGTG